MLIIVESGERERKNTVYGNSLHFCGIFWTSETVQLRLKNDHKDTARIETIYPTLGLDTENPNYTSVSV